MDFRRVRCVYHPQQYITNFCQSLQCLLPLCPTCIGQHSMYHDSTSTKGNFTNISEIYIKTQQQLVSMGQRLQAAKGNIDQFNSIVQNVGCYVRQKISLIRSLAIQKIEQIFDDIERSTLSSIEKKFAQNTIQNKNNKVYIDRVNQKIRQIERSIINLKTQNGLQTIIRFLNQNRQKYQHEIDKAKNKIKVTFFYQIQQSHVPQIKINQHFSLTQLRNSLLSMFSINYISKSNFSNIMNTSRKSQTYTTRGYDNDIKRFQYDHEQQLSNLPYSSGKLKTNQQSTYMGIGSDHILGRRFEQPTAFKFSLNKTGY